MAKVLFVKLMIQCVKCKILQYMCLCICTTSVSTLNWYKLCISHISLYKNVKNNIKEHEPFWNFKHLKDQTFYNIITLYYVNNRRKLLILHPYYLTHIKYPLPKPNLLTFSLLIYPRNYFIIYIWLIQGIDEYPITHHANVLSYEGVSDTAGSLTSLNTISSDNDQDEYNLNDWD